MIITLSIIWIYKQKNIVRLTAESIRKEIRIITAGIEETTISI